MAKTLDILVKHGKDQGIKDIEVVIMSFVKTLEAAAPELAIDAEETWGKSLGGLSAMVLPAIKPAVEKLADLNHDGHIG